MFYAYGFSSNCNRTQARATFVHRRGRQLCLLTLQCVIMDGPLENEGLLSE